MAMKRRRKTEKGLLYEQEYRRSEARRLSVQHYDKSEKGKITKRRIAQNSFFIIPVHTAEFQKRHRYGLLETTPFPSLRLVCTPKTTLFLRARPAMLAKEPNFYSITFLFKSKSRRTIAHEYDLAYDTSRPEQLVCASGFGKRKSLRDERLDLLLSKQIEQSDQILSEHCWLQPFEPLDPIGHHPFPARQQPAAGNI